MNRKAKKLLATTVDEGTAYRFSIVDVALILALVTVAKAVPLWIVTAAGVGILLVADVAQEKIAEWLIKLWADVES
jgi:hypothetical protein